MEQEQMFRQAQKRSAIADEGFLSLVAAGLTRAELEKLVEKRPALYGRFARWLDKLPE